MNELSDKDESSHISEPDRAKALEHVMGVARYTLDYFESSAKQVEDKSRNNLALGTAVVGVGALIAKTDEVIKAVRPIVLIVNNKKETIYSPSIWVYISILPLIVASVSLLYLAYQHYKIQKAQEFEMIKPEDIREFRDVVKVTDNTSLANVTIGLSESYIKSSIKAEEAFDIKSKILPSQEKSIQVIFWSTIIYIISAILVISLIPSIK